MRDDHCAICGHTLTAHIGPDGADRPCLEVVEERGGLCPCGRCGEEDEAARYMLGKLERIVTGKEVDRGEG